MKSIERFFASWKWYVLCLFAGMLFTGVAIMEPTWWRAAYGVIMLTYGLIGFVMWLVRDEVAKVKDWVIATRKNPLDRLRERLSDVRDDVDLLRMQIKDHISPSPRVALVPPPKPTNRSEELLVTRTRMKAMQKELGKMLGLRQESISQMERGRTPLTKAVEEFLDLMNKK